MRLKQTVNLLCRSSSRVCALDQAALWEQISIIVPLRGIARHTRRIDISTNLGRPRGNPVREGLVVLLKPSVVQNVTRISKHRGRSRRSKVLRDNGDVVDIIHLEVGTVVCKVEDGRGCRGECVRERIEWGVFGRAEVIDDVVAEGRAANGEEEVTQTFLGAKCVVSQRAGMREKWSSQFQFSMTRLDRCGVTHYCCPGTNPTKFWVMVELAHLGHVQRKGGTCQRDKLQTSRLKSHLTSTKCKHTWSPNARPGSRGYLGCPH